MMDEEPLVLRVVGIYNERAGAATGGQEGEHVFASEHQQRLVASGLDIDMDALLAFVVTLGEMMDATAGRYPDRGRRVLVDGLLQAFIVGALHEQERAKREAASA